MNILEKWQLDEDISIALVDQYPKELYKKQSAENLTGHYPFLQWKNELTEEAKEKLQLLEEPFKALYKIRLALLKNDELIGSCFGWQDSPMSFLMGASFVIKDFRFKGYYSKMLEKILELTREKGYQEVSSFHLATNNPILIAKLKQGFNVTGMQLDAVHGILIKMVYHHNSLLDSAKKFRAGAIGEKKILSLLQGP